MNIYKDIFSRTNDNDMVEVTKRVSILIAVFYNTLIEEGIERGIAFELTFMYAESILFGKEDNVL